MVVKYWGGGGGQDSLPIPTLLVCIEAGGPKISCGHMDYGCDEGIVLEGNTPLL